MSALCLTLAEQSLATLNGKIRSYADRVAFIEVRLDYLSDPGCLPRLPETPTRFIATCRPLGEGGRYQGPESERLKILQRSADTGFAWIDLESCASFDVAVFNGASVLRSHHDFSACPSRLTELYRDLQRLPGQAVKMAVTPADTGQTIQLLRWMEALTTDESRVILGMGKVGQPTRVLGPLLGSLWTYVVEDAGCAVAPGQFSLRQASGVLRFKSWSEPGRRPSFFAVLAVTDVGFRICRIFNRLFEEEGLNAFCLPLTVDVVAPWLEYLLGSTLEFQGLALAGMSSEPPAEPPEEAIDTLRRTEDGWQAGSTGVALDLPERINASDSRVWAAWLAGQFRFWTGSDVKRDLLETCLEHEMREREGEGH